MDIKTHRIKKIVLALSILVIGIIVLALLLSARPAQKPSLPEEKSWLVSVQKLNADDYTPQVIIYGLIESPITANIKAAITADVIGVPIREGQLVQAKQLLIQLDDRDVKLALQQYQAEVANLQAQIQGELTRFEKDKSALKHEQALLTLGQRSVDRQQHLTNTRAGSESQLDLAKEEVQRRALSVANRRYDVDDHMNRLATLTAALQKAQALSQQAKIDVERASVQSPFIGKIIKVNVARGDRVQIGDSLVQLFDTTDVEIRAQIPAQYITVVTKALAEDKPLQAHMTVANDTYTLQLIRLSGQVDRGKVGIDGLFAVKSGGKKLPLGRTVAIDLTLPVQKNVFSVPIQALYQANTVYRLTGDRVEAIDIHRVGQLKTPQHQTRVLIQGSDLHSGDKIVINQLPNIVSGLKVRVIEE